MSRTFFSLFTVALLQSAVSACFIVPSYFLLARENSGTAHFVFAALLIFAAVFLWILIQGGFCILILRIVRKQFVTIGYIFYPFRKFKLFAPLAFLGALVLALIFAAVRFAFKLILKLNPDAFSKLNEMFGEAGGVFAVAAVLLLPALLALFGMIFAFQFKFDNPNMSALKALNLSRRYAFRNFFRIAGFAILAGGADFLKACLYLVISLSFTGTSNFISGVFSFLFDFLYFLAVYRALARVCISVEIFYDELVTPKINIELPPEIIDDGRN